MKAKFWEIFYSNWRKDVKPKVPGYSILMMVPGDLPVFLKIALEVCSHQDSKNLVEVVVIPDNVPNGFIEYFNKLKKNWKNSPIRLATLNPAERFIIRHCNNPHMNNWLQFVRGCNSVSATHVLWHDADLFITEKDFMRRHFENCQKSNLYCYGLSEVWDCWYKENGFSYLTSTWELIMELDWVKRFKPWQHRGHDSVVNDMKHTFDITLFPQCLTSPHKISYWRGFRGFVHFNYIIGNYRNFQNSKGSFEDAGLKLLFIRLLIDLFDDSGGECDVPKFQEMLHSISCGYGRVTYNHDDRKKEYKDFRSKATSLKESFLLNEQQKALVKDRLDQLDSLFLQQYQEV